MEGMVKDKEGTWYRDRGERQQVAGLRESHESVEAKGQTLKQVIIGGTLAMGSDGEW